MVVESESGTKHLISENSSEGVDARDRLEEGSMCARNIRHLRYPVTTNLGFTYGANDEAKFWEFIVVEGTAVGGCHWGHSIWPTQSRHHDRR